MWVVWLLVWSNDCQVVKLWLHLITIVRMVQKDASAVANVLNVLGRNPLEDVLCNRDRELMSKFITDYSANNSK